VLAPRRRPRPGRTVLGVRLIWENPWGALPEAPPYVLPRDAETIGAWRPNDPEQQIITDLLPEPVFGDPLSAPVLLLALNPSWEPSDLALHADPVFSGRMREALLERQPFFWLQDGLDDTPGARWFKEKLGPLIDATSLGAVRNGVACLHLHQYHSKRSTPALRPHSSNHSKELARKAVANGATVLALAGAGQWRRWVSELAPPDALSLPKSPQAMVLSERNFPGAFDRAVDAIRHG
jgi:hypothetical protein